MYILISYDLIDTNDTTIHMISNNLDKAYDAYEDVFVKLDAWIQDGIHPYLIELLDIEEEFFDLNGFTLYWGEKHDKVKILRSNNRADEQVKITK